MSHLPIIARFAPPVTETQVAQVEALAVELSQTQELDLDETLRPLAGTEWPDAPELHIDDQSDISSLALPYDTSYIQDRARIRASTGDVVACNRAPTPGYEDYCRDHLKLGSVEWLSPEAQGHPRNLASHTWTSRSVRRELIHAARAKGLRTIHPLMGSQQTWLLALLLHRASRRPIQVLAPPPRLARWVNDKTEFAKTVTALFGAASLPLFADGTSLALISRHVKDIAAAYAHVGLKLPDSAGGAGILVVSSRRFRSKSLDAVADDMKKLVRAIGWRSGERLLVSGWESAVLASPSVQVWIPPGRDLPPPVVEGIFEQTIEGTRYEFVGTRPASFAPAVTALIVTRCWLMAFLYQLLGYVGRCSFDLVLTGNSREDCRPVLIECNGRWGGTSLPMTLMHRLFRGDPPAYIVRTITVRGLARIGFNTLLEHLGDDLLDLRTGLGRLVIFNPARIATRSGLSYIALGESDDQSRRWAEEEVPRRLRELTCGDARAPKLGLR